MSSKESWLTSSGDSAWNNGLKPLKSTVRSSAGLVRESGIVDPAGSRAVSPTSCVREM